MSDEKPGVRRHLYLITEHEDEDRVGSILTSETRFTRPEKNHEAPSYRHDEESGDFVEYGKKVGMGYVDFHDAEDLEENIGDEIKRKLAEIDRKWLEKAGHEPEEVLPA